MPFTFTMESRYKSPFKSNIPTLFIVFRNESYNVYKDKGEGTSGNYGFSGIHIVIFYKVDLFVTKQLIDKTNNIYLYYPQNM